MTQNAQEIIAEGKGGVFAGTLHRPLHRTGRNAAVVAIGQIILRPLGLIKHIVIARYLGAGHALDAFYVALLVPQMAARLLSWAISSTVIPLFLRKRQKSEEAARRFFLTVLNASFLFMGAVAALLFIFRGTVIRIVGSKLAGSDVDLAAQLLLILSAYAVIIHITDYLKSYLHANGRFLAASLSQSAATVAVILALLFLPGGKAHVLAWGTLLGFAFAAGLLLAAAQQAGLRYRPIIAISEGHIAKSVGLGLPYVGASLFSTGMLVIDQIMAARLTSGSLSSLRYAQFFMLVIQSTLIMSVGQALLPRFSTEIAQGDLDAARATYDRAVRGVSLLLFPVAAFTMVFAEPVVRVFLQRGAFGEPAVQMTFTTLACYMPMFLFAHVAHVSGKALAAAGASRILLLIGAGMCLMKVLGNWVLMSVFGVAGIALALSLMYIANAGLLTIALRKFTNITLSAYALVRIGRLALGALVSAMIGRGAYVLAESYNTNILAALCIGSLCAILCYLLFCLATAGEELRLLARFLPASLRGRLSRGFWGRLIGLAPADDTSAYGQETPSEKGE